MLAVDVIEPAQTEWGLLIVFVPKRDCTLRLSVEFRKLHAVRIRDSYQIRHVDECIDSLCNATIFSTLDVNSGY